ncbi:MAG: LamG-like jellyroll fold domain-containing protein, partial [Planctomycetaceae bacterium]
PAPAVGELLPEGVFGKGLETRRGGAVAQGKPEYRAATLTVELRTRLFQKEQYNILIASELKSSPTHWELFTQPGSGHLTLYSPGMQPDHVGTTVNLADGRWHAVGYLREPNRVRLYVDGKQVADVAVKAAQGRSTDDGLGFGTLVDRQLGCTGWLDDIRISSVARDLQTLGTQPLAVDEQTVGLWSLDELDEGRLRDSSKLKNPAVPVK